MPSVNDIAGLISELNSKKLAQTLASNLQSQDDKLKLAATDLLKNIFSAQDEAEIAKKISTLTDSDFALKINVAEKILTKKISWDDLAKQLDPITPQLAKLFREEDTPAKNSVILILSGLLQVPPTLEGLLYKTACPEFNEMAQKAEHLLSVVPEGYKSIMDMTNNNSRAFNDLSISTSKRIALWVFFLFLFTMIIVAASTFNAEAKKIISDNPSLTMLLGAVISAFTTVVQYYFGSSMGSAQKTVQLGQSQQASSK